MKCIYDFISPEGGHLPKEVKQCLPWCASVLPRMAPRSIVRPRYISTPPPIRIYSDGTGEGGLESLTLRPDSDAPFLLQSQADRALDQFATTTN